MVNFSETNIHINKFLNMNGIEGLENISEYINYGMHSTIVSQLKNIDLESEYEYANKILNKFMQGKDNAFTNINNIRTNIKSIDKTKIKILMIKAAIERHAFNIVKLKKESFNSNEDKVAQTITELVAANSFDDVFAWMDSDERIISILTETYIDLTYQKDKTLSEAYNLLTKQNSRTAKAMEQLVLYATKIK